MYSAEPNTGIHDAGLDKLTIPSANPLIGLKNVFEGLIVPTFAQLGLVRADSVIDRSEIPNPTFQGDELSLKTNLCVMADNPEHYPSNNIVKLSREAEPTSSANNIVRFSREEALAPRS
jgi:hypothetical protein